MTKRHEAKYKIDRRMGQNVWGRPKSPVNKREYGPGQHGQRRKGKLSDYGVQLKAKQKLRGYYGNILEKQFRGIYAEARRLKGDTGAHMIGLLERRLDAVIYRAKFVPTMFAARQFISHGHVKVNGRRVTIASYKVKVGEPIEVKDKSKQLALVLEATGLAERDVPGLHRGRPLQDDRQADPRSGDHRGALPGPDGAASGRRVLLALRRSKPFQTQTIQTPAHAGVLFCMAANPTASRELADMAIYGAKSLNGMPTFCMVNCLVSTILPLRAFEKPLQREKRTWMR